MPETSKNGAHRSQSTARNQLSHPVEGFALAGPSDLPDPTTHAYRKDLADAALASKVIASHYAEPLTRHVIAMSPFLTEADDSSNPVGILEVGDELRVLDLSRGWAWGYGPDGRVGYVRSEAVGI